MVSGAAAPKGPMTYAFTHGEISPPFSGWDLSVWAGIWVLRPGGGGT